MYHMYANYLKLDTLARSSDKSVIKLLSLAEGLAVQQLPHAVYGDYIFGVSAICDKWPLLNAIRNPLETPT